MLFLIANLLNSAKYFSSKVIFGRNFAPLKSNTKIGEDQQHCDWKIVNQWFVDTPSPHLLRLRRREIVTAHLHVSDTVCFFDTAHSYTTHDMAIKTTARVTNCLQRKIYLGGMNSRVHTRPDWSRRESVGVSVSKYGKRQLIRLKT